MWHETLFLWKLTMPTWCCDVDSADLVTLSKVHHKPGSRVSFLSTGAGILYSIHSSSCSKVLIKWCHKGGALKSIFVQCQVYDWKYISLPTEGFIPVICGKKGTSKLSSQTGNRWNLNQQWKYHHIGVLQKQVIGGGGFWGHSRRCELSGRCESWDDQNHNVQIVNSDDLWQAILKCWQLVQTPLESKNHKKRLICASVAVNWGDNQPKTAVSTSENCVLVCEQYKLFPPASKYEQPSHGILSVLLKDTWQSKSVAQTCWCQACQNGQKSSLHRNHNCKGRVLGRVWFQCCSPQLSPGLIFSTETEAQQPSDNFWFVQRKFGKIASADSKNSLKKCCSNTNKNNWHQIETWATFLAFFSFEETNTSQGFSFLHFSVSSKLTFCFMTAMQLILQKNQLDDFRSSWLNWHWLFVSSTPRCTSENPVNQGDSLHWKL